MTITPLKTCNTHSIRARAVAAIALGVGLAAFASVPASLADWHDRGGAHAFHGPAFHDFHGGRGHYHGGFGFGFGFYDPYAYYGYPYPYAYGDPGYAYPPPAVYAPPPAIAADPASNTYTAANGQTCRQYVTTRVINGGPQQVYGTACLQPDGTWRVVN